MKRTATKLGVILTGIIFITTSGCATIFKGSSADIRVNSAPAGATVYINNIDRGETPQTLSLSRNESHVLVFKKDGYEDVTVEVDKKFDFATTVVGNIFSWSLLGIVVDVATGAAYSLSPADVQANMSEMRAAGFVPEDYQPEKNEVFVVMLTKEEWEALKVNK